MGRFVLCVVRPLAREWLCTRDIPTLHSETRHIAPGKDLLVPHISISLFIHLCILYSVFIQSISIFLSGLLVDISRMTCISVDILMCFLVYFLATKFYFCSLVFVFVGMTDLRLLHKKKFLRRALSRSAAILFVFCFSSIPPSPRVSYVYIWYVSYRGQLTQFNELLTQRGFCCYYHWWSFGILRALHMTCRHLCPRVYALRRSLMIVYSLLYLSCVAGIISKVHMACRHMYLPWGVMILGVYS